MAWMCSAYLLTITTKLGCISDLSSHLWPNRKPEKASVFMVSLKSIFKMSPLFHYRNWLYHLMLPTFVILMFSQTYICSRACFYNQILFQKKIPKVFIFSKLRLMNLWFWHCTFHFVILLFMKLFTNTFSDTIIWILLQDKEVSAKSLALCHTKLN